MPCRGTDGGMIDDPAKRTGHGPTAVFRPGNLRCVAPHSPHGAASGLCPRGHRPRRAGARPNVHGLYGTRWHTTGIGGVAACLIRFRAQSSGSRDSRRGPKSRYRWPVRASSYSFGRPGNPPVRGRPRPRPVCRPVGGVQPVERPEIRTRSSPPARASPRPTARRRASLPPPITRRAPPLQRRKHSPPRQRRRKQPLQRRRLPVA